MQLAVIVLPLLTVQPSLELPCSLGASVHLEQLRLQIATSFSTAENNTLLTVNTDYTCTDSYMFVDE